MIQVSGEQTEGFGTRCSVSAKGDGQTSLRRGSQRGAAAQPPGFKPTTLRTLPEPEAGESERLLVPEGRL